LKNSCDYQELENNDEYIIEVNFLGSQTLFEILKDYVTTKIKHLQDE
jgi:hypothetical protein